MTRARWFNMPFFSRLEKRQTRSSERYDIYTDHTFSSICLTTYFVFHFQDSHRRPSSNNNESHLLSLPRLAGREVSSSIYSSSTSKRRQYYGLFLSIRNGRWLKSRWRGVLQRDSICSATSWPASPETPPENHFTTRHHQWHQDCANLFTVYRPSSRIH